MQVLTPIPHMQTIGPLCVEVAGLKSLQSLLSLSWAAVIIPATGYVSLDSINLASDLSANDTG